MRYIYVIIAIIALASAGVGLFLFAGQGPAPEIAIKVDGRIITKAEFNQLYAAAPSGTSRQEFIQSLITRELLLNAAEVQGVDKEESFRRSLKNYYEQSLTKLLMDRKFASMPTGVADAEIDIYVALYGKRFTLTRFVLPDTKISIGDLAKQQGERLELAFADLSQDMQLMLLSLSEGEFSEPIREASGYVAFRVEKIEEAQPAAPLAANREEVRQRLKEAKAASLMDGWLEELAGKAGIEVHIEP